MAAIARLPLELPCVDPWAAVADAVSAWLLSEHLERRDVIVLLPFAQLLPVARRAFGAKGGWMPRIETTQSLAHSLGHADRPAADELSLDPALDRVVADRLLRAQSWAAAWAADDAPGFAQAVESVVDSAHALARAAFALPPADRASHWERARALFSLQSVAAGAPGSRERLLNRVALEWAAAASTPATDALFSLRAAGWVALRAGGPDRLTDSVLEAAAPFAPCLVLDVDADPADPFALLVPPTPIQVARCDDFEQEAQRSAACVLNHLRNGQQPVALISQDRLLVRRVRALLGRQGVTLRDETGWRLSTTRSGASLRAMLTCAREDASTDDWLDWLKCCAGDGAASWPSVPAVGAALDELELALRERKLGHARSVTLERLTPRAAALWRAALAVLRPLSSLGIAPGSEWLSALAAALRATGQYLTLNGDDAGRQVLAALRLLPSPVPAPLASEMLDRAGFQAWVDAALEQASFLPESPATAAVVITPLARAMLRPFAAVVFPGVDERHLAAPAPATGLLADSECAALGLPDRRARADVQALAFAQLLRLPRLTLLHRVADDGEPLALSPLVELLRLSLLRRLGTPNWMSAADPRTWEAVLPSPVQRPLPRAPSLLPHRLSASACEALRACPYRFFALRLLRLSAPEELDTDLEKREYGNWLHAVLQRFHGERAAPMAAEIEVQRLHQIAAEQRLAHGLDEAEFLPYSASFARLAPRYVAWQHQRDAEGAQWLDAELKLTAQPPAWGAVQMHGVIDRVDFADEQGVPTTQLIDYKTGQAQALRDAIRQGEDTQLPFYVALMAAQNEAPGEFGAMYLMLDESEKVLPVPHAEVQASAQALVEGIGKDLARLAGGAAMPALGEGRACDFCDARGLCRRDHWPSTATTTAATTAAKPAAPA